VKRTLWQEVDWEGFDIGDWVEVLSRGKLNTPRTGTIRENHWDSRRRCMMYQLRENDQLLVKFYTADDLRHVDAL